MATETNNNLKNPTYNKETPMDTRIKDLESKVEQMLVRIKRLKECKEVYNNLPYKEQDVAWHKDHGPVIVRAIEFGTPDSDFEDMKYVAVTITANTIRVPWRELLPYNDTTRALYGKQPESK